jgi:hypothetical protein
MIANCPFMIVKQTFKYQFITRNTVFFLKKIFFLKKVTFFSKNQAYFLKYSKKMTVKFLSFYDRKLSFHGS